jgi:hypothetical protein
MRERLIALIQSDTKGKPSIVFFSWGCDAQTYKTLYQVDRFDKVIANIRYLIEQLNCADYQSVFMCT